MTNGNDIVEHIEKCWICQDRESIIDMFSNYDGKKTIQQVITEIRQQEIECCEQAGREE